MKELQRIVKDKVESFDPTAAAQEGEKSEWTGEAMGFFDLAHSHTSPMDKCMFYVGIFFSFAFGAALPCTFIIFA